MAIAAALLMTSGSALALECPDRGDGITENIQHITSGEVDALTNFLPASDWGYGSIAIEDKVNGVSIETTAGTVAAYSAYSSGWMRFMDDTRTAIDDGFATNAPDGDDGNYIYMNQGRVFHKGGIAREISCIEPLGSYDLSANAATEGSLVWAYSYTKVGEDTETIVNLTETELSNSEWVTAEDSFKAPYDIDVAKPFKVILRTVGDDTVDIYKTATSQIWADDFSLIEKPFESEITEPKQYIPGNVGELNELDASTVYPDGWPSNAGYISADEHGNYSPELNGIYIPSLGTAGIVMVLSDHSSGDFNNCARAHPNAEGDSDFTVDRCLAINWRGSHDAGIARVIENIVPGGSYVYSVEGASHFGIVLSYSYTKLGESEQTKVILTEEAVSATNPDWPDLYHWHTMEEAFNAPRDIDVTKPFQLNISTDDDEPLPNSDGNKRVLYAANFSLIEIPIAGDTDEDGVVDTADAFPENPAAAKDTDADGKPDDFMAECDQTCIDGSGLELDDDDDNDGVLDVNDGHPLDDSKNVLISIESSTAIAGTEVMLDASASIPSMDVAGTIYTWEQTVGSFDLTPSGQTLTFIPPVSETKVEAEFSLTVETPTQTYSELYPVTIYKTPATITPNLVITGRDESNGTTVVETRDPDTNEVIETIEYLNVMPGEEITLDASGATDSDGFTLSHNWEWTITQWWNGRIVAEGTDTTTPTLSFTVPEWSESFPETFTLTLTNNEADMVEDSFENTVKTIPVYIYIVRNEIPKEIHKSTKEVGGGSFGFIGMFLLSAFSLIRRFVKTKSKAQK